MHVYLSFKFCRSSLWQFLVEISTGLIVVGYKISLPFVLEMCVTLSLSQTEGVELGSGALSRRNCQVDNTRRER
jgi:hypothetical protein